MRVIIITALGCLLTQAQDEVAQIAYLPENRYNLQNDFVSNLLARIENEGDFQFQLVSYQSLAEIEACLQDGTCVAAIDYEYNGKGDVQLEDSVTNSERIPLSILDDPVLTCTLPQYG